MLRRGGGRKGSISKRMAYKDLTEKKCLRRPGGGEGERDPIRYQGLEWNEE